MCVSVFVLWDENSQAKGAMRWGGWYMDVPATAEVAMTIVKLELVEGADAVVWTSLAANMRAAVMSVKTYLGGRSAVSDRTCFGGR